MPHKVCKKGNAVEIVSLVGILTVVLMLVAPGCQSSSGPPKAPKVRIEGPPGTPVGYSVSYFDGKDDLDTTGTVKIIPDSGAYTEELKGGHQGVLVQIIPNKPASVTVILLDGDREIQRATGSGDKDAQVQAGKLTPVGPFRRP